MSQSYWTAASETHQRESNTFITQLNNRSVKDRSFSRKIESERSFFVSESHRIRWISEQMNSMYSRREEANKEVMSMVGSMMAAMQANKGAISIIQQQADTDDNLTIQSHAN